MPEQNRAEPASLKLIADGEGNFGAMFVQPGIERMADDELVGSAQRDQAERAIEIGFTVRLGRER